MASKQVLNKLKVLCLHGYTQNGELFRRRSAVLRKDLKNVADMVYIDAPIVIPPDRLDFAPSDLTDAGPLCWWLMNADGSEYEHYEKFVDSINTVWKEKGPFDVILGFSQGATAAALAAQFVTPSPRFTIIFSGFLPYAPIQKNVFVNPEKPLIPSLQFLGDTDQWVTSNRSLDLADCWKDKNVKVVHHPGGHFIPTDKNIRTLLKEWFSERIADPNLSSP